MRVLLIGSGGREHALAVGLAADPAVEQLIAAPGNPGIAQVAELRDVTATDPAAVAALAVETGADLVVVGPEAPLVAGVADAVRAKGIACFGPSAAAAQLEGSKEFAKDVMLAAGVPTALHYACTTEAEVQRALDDFGPPYVVKNDGLAAGKGVVVTVLAGRGAGARAGVRQGRGRGVPARPRGVALRGHRRHGGGAADAGAGLQAGRRRRRRGRTPAGWARTRRCRGRRTTWSTRVMAETVEPTLAEMRRRGTPFAGLLYVGLALTPDGPKVIEFNARFGDPETQVVLALLATPLGGLLQAAATGTLAEHPPLRWHAGRGGHGRGGRARTIRARRVPVM